MSKNQKNMPNSRGFKGRKLFQKTITEGFSQENTVSRTNATHSEFG